MSMNDATYSTSAADRARLYRERKSVGIIVVPVEVDREDVNSLVEYGLLKPQNSADRREIGEALELVLAALYEGAIGFDFGWFEANVDQTKSTPP